MIGIAYVGGRCFMSGISGQFVILACPGKHFAVKARPAWVDRPHDSLFIYYTEFQPLCQPYFAFSAGFPQCGGLPFEKTDNLSTESPQNTDITHKFSNRGPRTLFTLTLEKPISV